MKDNESQPNITRVLTSKEVSDYLRIPVSTLWTLTKKGKIRGIKVGKHWRYLESEVHAFLNGNGNGSVASESISNKRIFQRINCEIPVRIFLLIGQTNDSEKVGMISNLSEGGARIICRGLQAKVGDPVKMFFLIPENGSHLSEFRGRVIYVYSNSTRELGIKFKNVSPSDRKAIVNYVG